MQDSEKGCYSSKQQDSEVAPVMRHKIKETEYLLDRAGVDAVSEQIGEWLKKTGYQKENILRLRLTMEELLLRVCEHFEEKMTGTLVMTKRFGTPVLRFRYRGEAYDPYAAVKEPETASGSSSERTKNLELQSVQSENSGSPSEKSKNPGHEKEPLPTDTDEYVRQMLSRMGLSPEWGYRAGVNEITLRGPRQTLRSEFWLIGAAVLAIIIGLMPVRIPETVSTGILEYLLKPVSGAFLHAVNAFVGIMIFLSVVSGICSIGSVADFSKMGRHVILRLIGNSFLSCLFGIFALLPLFHFGNTATGGGESQIGEIVDLIFSIIPSDPVSPFMNGNILQIIFLAVMLGIALLILGDNVITLKKIIEQANAAFTQILSSICRLLPLYIFTSLIVLFRENGAAVLARLWKPVVIAIGINALLMMIKLIYTSIKLRVSAGLLLKKVLPTVVVGLLTASSSAAFGKMSDLNEKELGIAPELNRFALPFANILTGGVAGAGLVLIIYYLSEGSGIAVSPGWLLTLWLMCSLFGMTMPPVAGGMLICVGMVLTQLNMPKDNLAVAGILGILTDFFMTASKISSTHMELLLDADHFKMLNRQMLEKQTN